MDEPYAPRHEAFPPPSPERAGWRHYGVAAALLLGSLVLYYVINRLLLAYDPRLSAAFQGGSMAAMATLLGTLPVLLSQQFSQRTHDLLLGFGAGVMLAASFFSLISPGLLIAASQGYGEWGAASVVGTGIFLGALLLFAIDKLVPHEHFVKGVEGWQAYHLKRTWLFVWAIVLHNFPEGLAIGVAFSGTDEIGAKALATGISIQDVPEGLVVAAALNRVGYSRIAAVSVGAASGLVEPLAAVLGAGVITLSALLLPWGLAFAAGAMLYIISHEIIPESHRAGHETFATGGFMVGFVMMMLLDTALG